VSFQTDKGSTEVWNYKSVNDKWTFIQLNISGDHQTLKVKMKQLVYYNCFVTFIKGYSHLIIMIYIYSKVFSSCSF
jgi:hypothetical protein